jgi:hypothetical protein
MIVVLSGFLVAALSNTKQGLGDPLSIVIPSQLWILMGISTTSLVGSPLIRSSKATAPTPDLTKVKENFAQKQVDPSIVDAKGKILVWPWPSDARVTDLFEGDEVSNGAHLDLGKVQMFFFTVIVVFAYIVALARTFSAVKTGRISELPPLDEGMVALMGISHAGFLTNNAIPRA